MTTITVTELERMLFDQDAEAMALPFEILWDITDEFSEAMIIGTGGFGVVYKGKLPRKLVAVKKLRRPSMLVAEFEKEAVILMKLKHRYIIRLLGYCAISKGYIETKKGKTVMLRTDQKLLCFEHLGNGSLDRHIRDPYTGLDWRTRYEIIKGICEGVEYLHRMKVMHLDLKPENILLDDNYFPKITDFGLSRSFVGEDKDKTHLTVSQVAGTSEYLPPEKGNKKLTYKYDVYSLGCTILRILRGMIMSYEVTSIQQIWNNRLDTTYAHIQWKQIEVCAEIGLGCIEKNPAKRPDMNCILQRFREMEIENVIPGDDTRNLLDVHPYALYFPFEPNRSTFCSLDLKNNTDKHVIFILLSNEPSGCFLELPIYGAVPPRSPYTLIVRTLTKHKTPERNKIALFLRSTNLVDEHIQKFQNQTTKGMENEVCHLFDKANEMRNVVQVVKLEALWSPRPVIETSSKKILPGIKSFHMDIIRNSTICSLDADEDKQWIITGEKNGYAHIFNYQTQKKVDFLRVSTEIVTCVKFIARKQWFVVATKTGDVHVYAYKQKIEKKIKSFRAADKSIMSLAVHETKPYLLATSSGSEMNLWDWNRDWVRINTFEEVPGQYIRHVAFNSKDNIASICSDDNTVKLWSLDSSMSTYTLSGHLPGHTSRVNCLDFFTHDGQEYLVTGSDDRTAKIWDLQKKICVCTIEALSRVKSILYQPQQQILITGSGDPAFYFWSGTDFFSQKGGLRPASPSVDAHNHVLSTDFRLKRIIDIGCPTEVKNLPWLVARVAMDLDYANNYEEESSDDDSEIKLSGYHTITPVDKTSEVTEGSSRKLPILHVHSRELHFPCEPQKFMPCLLHLTNKTGQTVAFRIIHKVIPIKKETNRKGAVRTNSHGGRLGFRNRKLYDSAVPPRSSYTLVVITRNPMNKPKETIFNLVLQSSISEGRYLVPFKDNYECQTFFDEAIEVGNVVHEVTLRAVCAPSGIQTPSEPTILQRMKICTHFLFPTRPSEEDLHLLLEKLSSFDAHPTEPWILTGHLSGKVRIWNYSSQFFKQVLASAATGSSSFWPKCFGSTKKPTHYFVIEERKEVRCIKFIVGKKLIIFGTGSGRIHVYIYDKLPGMQMLTSFSYHVDPTSLVVHSTQHYVISNCMVLLDWNKDGSLYEKAKFDSASVTQVVFNPNDPNSFASAEYISYEDRHGIVKVWSIDPRVVMYTLSGHSAEVSCLDFFTRDDGQYLITGSKDCTAKIWDLRKRACKHTMEAMSPIISVISLPGRPYLVTASESGILHVWSSTDFRLKRILNLGGGGHIRGLVCMKGSQRVLIGQGFNLSIMDIDDDEATSSEITN